MEKQFNRAFSRVLDQLGLLPAGPEHQSGLYRHGDVPRTSKVLAIALVAVALGHVADAIQQEWLLAAAAAIAAYLYQGHRWPQRQRLARVAIAVGAALIAFIIPLFLVTIAAAAVALRYQATHRPRPLSGVLALGELVDQGGSVARDIAVFAEDLDALLHDGALGAELARQLGVDQDVITTRIASRTPATDELPARLEVTVAAHDRTLATAFLAIGRLRGPRVA